MKKRAAIRRAAVLDYAQNVRSNLSCDILNELILWAKGKNAELTYKAKHIVRCARSASYYGSNVRCNSLKKRLQAAYADGPEGVESLFARMGGKDWMGSWVGVEIECFHPSMLRASSIPQYSWVEWKEDSSVEPDEEMDSGYDKDDNLVEQEGYSTVHFGEVAILCRPGKMDRINTIVNWLNREGCAVNATCGLHVHLDVRHLSNAGRHLMYKRLVRALPLLAKMVARHRLDNGFCRDNNSVEEKAAMKERFMAINFQAVQDHKTIEIRLHESILNADYIRMWVSLLKFIARTPRRMSDWGKFRLARPRKSLRDWVEGCLRKRGEVAWMRRCEDRAGIVQQAAPVQA